jgi:hypothetical protein
VQRAFAELAVDQGGGGGERLRGVLKLAERLELDDLRAEAQPMASVGRRH